jgi:hypothetical protein
MIETDYKLYTAEIELSFYYSEQGKRRIINIVALDLQEALLVAEKYVEKHHCYLKLINNDWETIYTLAEIERIGNSHQTVNSDESQCWEG